MMTVPTATPATSDAARAARAARVAYLDAVRVANSACAQQITDELDAAGIEYVGTAAEGLFWVRGTFSITVRESYLEFIAAGERYHRNIGFDPDAPWAQAHHAMLLVFGAIRRQASDA